MLLVKTKIGPSEIQGIGLFADQFIPKGTAVWKFMPGFDLKTSKNALNELSQPAKEIFLKYAYLNPKTDKYVLCFDNARFLNHADEPNVISIDSPDDEEGIDVAAQDIRGGEELTGNYKEFDADFDCKMAH